MQNRNVIKLFAILFGIVCLYQLSFTWVADSIEEDAVVYADNFSEDQRDAKTQFYLDSINSEEVYDILLTSYTYGQCKQREINLGLDLKGGMNVTLEVMVVDVVRALSNNSKDSIFNLAITNALKAQENNSKDDFVSLFAIEYENLTFEKNKGLSAIFATPDLKEKIDPFSSTNKEVIAVLNLEVEDAINRSFNILRSRIDRFGVTQPNIQRLETAGRILVELPGIKNPERARKLLQSTAQLEFWETHEYNEVFDMLEKVNSFLRETNSSDDVSSELNDSEELLVELDPIKSNTDSLKQLEVENNALLAELEGDTALSDTSTGALTFEEFALENPLYALLFPNVDQQTGQLNPGPVVGFCAIQDTAELNKYLNDPAIQKFFPIDVHFAYTVKPYDSEGKFLQLVALKSDRNGKSAMEGDVITDANQGFNQFGSSAEVSMSMNPEGAKQWKRLTAENIGKSVAIVLDGYIYSYPTVQAEISGGRSQITGNFTVEEAKDLANILKSGKLPAPARIIEEAIVGPSLGEEAINAGLKSFIFALVIVLLYMIFYYNRAGLVSNIALLANIFFIFGVLSSLGAVLTLPGIAGIVLTIGMSVDANVLIYERIREEIKNGKGLRLAISDGYNSAYSSIIDANVTTLLTGIILYTFGTGPIKGFATTLVIGILTSLFAAIFITRLVISSRLSGGTWRLWQKFFFGVAGLNILLLLISLTISSFPYVPGKEIFISFILFAIASLYGKKEEGESKAVSFSNKFTDGAFKNINIDFIGNRKKFYVFSSIIILLGIGSLFTKGLNYGVDFTGGRTFVVRFDNVVDKEALRSSLTNVFVDENGLNYTPQVKTFGEENQLKITTSFMIDNNSVEADSIIESKLYAGCKSFLVKEKSLDSTEITKSTDKSEIEQFREEYIMSSQKVGPTIADDIKDAAVWSIFFSLLIIFIYILIRFRKWQFSLGAVAAVFHDVLIVLSIFSVLYGVLPFSLEIDQAFIAAILTIIGYSLNDTVVVFDRVREYMYNNKKKQVHEIMNGALNSTLSRTINTSLTTFFVLLVIFVFGGEVIRGFMFALMVGVIIGTYSSLFVASPIMLDTVKPKK